MLKRTFDVVTATAGVILLSPILAVIAVLVKVDSAGPVFHRGGRTGLHGQLFRIFKFRTMVVGAEVLGGLSTAKDDPRVTRIGRVLRRYKLDELPQLINVFRGEMSIVGPRPEVPEYTRLYAGEEQVILSVRPGITDYASIEFVHLGEILGNDQPDKVYEEKVRPIKNALRVKYVKEQSFLRDLVIIWLTFVTLLESILGRTRGARFTASH